MVMGVIDLPILQAQNQHLLRLVFFRDCMYNKTPSDYHKSTR